MSRNDKTQNIYYKRQKILILPKFNQGELTVPEKQEYSLLEWKEQWNQT